ncbi:MAG TPA: MarR family winged helix-turn-helix transcriptional regulator [Sporichthyaceae bacterium]|nr:MarR family winged helix-turn-helix transcriptional regulator [Sporichthyaceae bacterium]
MSRPAPAMSDADYERLLGVRTALRRFQQWSEAQARSQGLTPAQHQLLLTIKGHPDPQGPSMGEIADYLCIRHHSTVELVNRAETAGYVVRRPDPDNARVVRVVLSRSGDAKIRLLSPAGLDELSLPAQLLVDLAAYSGEAGNGAPPAT